LSFSFESGIIKLRNKNHKSLLYRNRGANGKRGEKMTEETKKGEASDVEKNKALAIVGYIIPILFFVPLVSDAKNSPYAKFHANQQLNLLISWIVVEVVGTVIPFIGWLIILPLGTIFLIVIAIMGIINASKGEMKELPVIGGFKLLS
jgi:uncharacterized membrane protein